MKNWLRKALEPVIASGVEKAFAAPSVQLSLKRLIWRALYGDNGWNDPLSDTPDYECAWPECGCCIDAICDIRLIGPKTSAALKTGAEE